MILLMILFRLGRRLHGRLALPVPLPELSADVEMARNYYNATARDYNTRLGQFPSNLVGRVFRFGEAEYLESDPLS